MNQGAGEYHLSPKTHLSGEVRLPRRIKIFD